MFEKSALHLQESKITYWQHFSFAIIAGFKLIVAGIASLIHAIIPQWFPGLAAYTVIELYKQRLEEHPNPDYQKKIRETVSDETNQSRNN